MGPVDVERSWDDELIDAVWDAYNMQIYYADEDERLDSLYAVIAAVEDWHKAKRDSRDRTHSDDCWRWHQECAEALIEAQQAAIQRVRELIDTADTFTPPLVLTTAELRRALDGADEDNQADFWDGDVPLGGDDMDGK